MGRMRKVRIAHTGIVGDKSSANLQPISQDQKSDRLNNIWTPTQIHAVTLFSGISRTKHSRGYASSGMRARKHSSTHFFPLRIHVRPVYFIHRMRFIISNFRSHTDEANHLSLSDIQHFHDRRLLISLSLRITNSVFRDDTSVDAFNIAIDKLLLKSSFVESDEKLS